MEQLPARIEVDDENAELLGKEPDVREVTFYFSANQFSGFLIGEKGFIYYYVGGIEICCEFSEESLKICKRLCN